MRFTALRRVRVYRTSASTSIAYATSPSYASESTLNFNGSRPTVDTRATVDSLGRTPVMQQKQSQSSSTYDSVETDYDSLGRLVSAAPSGRAADNWAPAPWSRLG